MKPAVVMVDSNIQRENIQPSEKAKAYKIKYDAMKNQGKAGNSLKMMSEESGENYKIDSALYMACQIK